jgi:cytochrome bd-type quinol oxidase subunit 2
MKKLTEELRIVSPIAWVITVLMYAGFATLLAFVTGNDPNISQWPPAGRWLFSLSIPLIMAIYVILIGYVNADARRRGMRYVVWTLLAIFVPNALGIILYFVIRDPLMTPCAACGIPAKQGFAFCPACGAPMAHACPSCRRAVDPQWSHCVACGAKVQ